MDGDVTLPMLGGYKQSLSFHGDPPDVTLLGIACGAGTREGGDMRRIDGTAPSAEHEECGGAAAFLGMWSQNARVIHASDESFGVGDAALAAALDAPETLSPGWIAECDITLRGYTISEVGEGVLMVTAYHDGPAVDTSGESVEVERNVMHGVLVRRKRAWRVPSTATAHGPGTAEALLAIFARHQGDDRKAIRPPRTLVRALGGHRASDPRAPGSTAARRATPCGGSGSARLTYAG